MITDSETDHFRFYLPHRIRGPGPAQLETAPSHHMQGFSFYAKLRLRTTLRKDKTFIKSTGDCNFELREITLGHKHGTKGFP